MDKNKLFDEKNFSKGLSVCAPWKNFGQKIKDFEIFFDIIDNHTRVHVHVKKIFKIFHFSAKFLNFLKGPPVEFFLDRFFQLACIAKPNSLWVLTFGLDQLPREL